MNCCDTKCYKNNPCVPFEAIAPRDGLVVEKCDECRDGYCYNMDDTADCYWCGKLVMMDGCDYFCMGCLDFCEECGTLYDRIYDEDEDKQFKLLMESIQYFHEDRNDTDLSLMFRGDDRMGNLCNFMEERQPELEEGECDREWNVCDELKWSHEVEETYKKLFPKVLHKIKKK
tara:strand:- start:457 stop:975 length:519 start_codon:yes stop_codon:yes gene_type:complete